MNRSGIVLLRVSVALLVSSWMAIAYAGGPPKGPSGPGRCSVASVGEDCGAAGGVALLALGVTLAAARRRGRR